MLGRINCGGAKINGIIEEYKVANGGNVSAGDFVKKINDGEEYMTTNGEPTNQRAVLLSENKVFIIYTELVSSSYRLYGIVCTIDEDAITFGESLSIATADQGYYRPSIAVLSSNKVFITYKYGSGYLYGSVYTIDGTTITHKSSKKLTTTVESDLESSITALSENKVFIAYYFSGSLNFVYGIVCTIDDTTITAGEKKSILSSSSSKMRGGLELVSLSQSKIFILSGYLYGVICTVNDTTITVGEITMINSDISVTSNNISLLSESKVFITYAKNTNLYGIVCTIDGTTITIGENILISNSIKGSNNENHSIATISENKVFVVYSSNLPAYSAYGVICTIDGTIITIEKTINILTSDYELTTIMELALTTYKIFMAYYYNISSSTGFTCKIKYIENMTSAIENSTDIILGLAKTSGTAGQKIKVYTPKIENIESEEI